MKNCSLACLALWILCAWNTTAETLDGTSQYQSYAPDGIPFVITERPWTADQRGSHRAAVHYAATESVDAVVAELPWRRPDLRVDSKKILVVDAETEREISDVQVLELTSERGVVLFRPTQSSDYYVYYLPFNFRKKYHDARYGPPWNDYLPPVYHADKDWLNALPEDKSTLPHAEILRFEDRTEFDAFTPMGLIATQEEMKKVATENPENPVIFTEDRAYPARLTAQLSARWAQRGASRHFSGTALRNEYYVWQIGIWAAHGNVNDVKLQFTDFITGAAHIDQSNVTCFNLGGTNWNGQPIEFTVDVPHNNVQTLWCGIQIPEDTKPGFYTGHATLSANGLDSQTVDITLQVRDEILPDKGDGDLWRHARLRWLNSTIGLDNHPIAPYLSMTTDRDTIIATDKQVVLAPNGLPGAILINGHQVLSSPMNFLVETSDGIICFEANNLELSQDADGLVSWKSKSVQHGITFTCSAYMEYDGYIHYELSVSSPSEIEVKDIRMVTDYTEYAATYFMGAGYKGGARPADYEWDWQGAYDSCWMGGAEAGLHTEFLGGSYHGPLLWDYKPAPTLNWYNEGEGRINVSGETGKPARLTISTGNDTLNSEPKKFEFALLITPLKPINPAKHFSERYFHADPYNFNKAAEDGANIANIHHAQTLNPVINYPFIVRDPLIKFIKEQHKNNRKVKLYYTIRELTTHTKEIYALKSLNHEIFVSGVGYGIPWQCEHLIDDYKPAWYTELPGETADAALVLNGFSRWINYYLEGLRWMFETYDIDGIYMDDVSFDRPVMKRMRKIMNRYHQGALIDLHSNTAYANGSANQYMGFFPYVDRLWFGESFQYNAMDPAEWFVTFSGIPFGQMSEMLQDGGNRFLGMVYGATARHSYSQHSPAPVWKLWKSFEISKAKMIGYWDEHCPITTDNPNVKATAYIKPRATLIAIGNFDTNDQDIQLTIDWEALGLDPANVEMSAPAVENFQPATKFIIGQSIPVKAKEGWLILLEQIK